MPCRRSRARTSPGADAPRIATELLDELRGQFLAAVAPGVARDGESSPAVSGQASPQGGLVLLIGPARTVRAMEVLGTAMVAMRDALDARITLEVALVRLTHPEADDDPGRAAGEDRTPRAPAARARPAGSCLAIAAGRPPSAGSAGRPHPPAPTAATPAVAPPAATAPVRRRPPRSRRRTRKIRSRRLRTSDRGRRLEHSDRGPRVRPRRALLSRTTHRANRHRRRHRPHR